MSSLPTAFAREAQGMERAILKMSAASWEVLMTELVLMDLASAANVSSAAFRVYLNGNQSLICILKSLPIGIFFADIQTKESAQTMQLNTY